MSSPLPNTIKFTKNKDLLVKGTNLAAGIEFVSVTDPATREALLKNEPFPKEAKLLDIKVQGEAGRDIAFAGNKGQVTFSVKGAVSAGFGVYLSSENLINDLNLNDDVEGGLEFPGGLGEYLLALRWGYNVGAQGQGSVALGAGGQLTFGAEVSRDATYAVIRRFPQKTRAYTAVQALANSWVLPTNVKTIADLEPGTWLVAEVNGSVAANIGVQFGYDFNWVREVNQGGLTGDIGLRLQLGLQASLGFNSSGQYAVVLCRESLDPADQHVRLRIFKQRQKGWNFALNAGATVQPSETFLPENYDDLIKAVFGVHGPQVVKGLETFDKWTNTQETLPAILAGAGLGEARKLLTAVTGKDPVAQFGAAKQEVLDFLDKWTNLDNLNHGASTLIWKVLDDAKDAAGLNGVLGDLKGLAGQIAGLDLDQVKQLLETRLQDVQFFKTPVGEWLEAAAGGGILRALSGSAEFAKLQQAAQATIRVLDGGPVEDVLRKLQDYIQANLGDELKKVEQIKNQISQADLDSLNKWLTARLTDFMGKELDLQELEQVRLALQTLREKSQAYYEAALKALNKQYNFSFAYTFQQATTRTALLDVVFDLSRADTPALMADAVDGNFNQLLVSRNDGVTLNEAHLTHQIERNGHVQISTPFYSNDTEHSNKSFADFTPVEEDGKLLLTYELDAVDVIKTKHRALSSLAVGGFWQVGTANQGVRVHSTESLNYEYSLRQANQDMKRADLEFQLTPYVEKYLTGVFNANGGGAASPSFPYWLSQLDYTVDMGLYGSPQPDKFGDVLLSLQVSLPSSVISSWNNAPKDKKSPLYTRLSQNLQNRLKRLTEYLYFQDPQRYVANQGAVAAAILLYAGIPPWRELAVENGKYVFDRQGDDIIWDWTDDKQIGAMLQHPYFNGRMKLFLKDAYDRLLHTQDYKDEAKDYEPTDDNIEDLVYKWKTNTFTQANLKALLQFESTVVRGAYDSCRKFVEFKDKWTAEPAAAIEALAEFGSEVTDTFHTELSGLHNGRDSRAMSTLLFLEAALALNPGTDPKSFAPSAILELIVLKKEADFQTVGDAYLDGELPKDDQVLIQQRMVSIN